MNKEPKEIYATKEELKNLKEDLARQQSIILKLTTLCEKMDSNIQHLTKTVQYHDYYISTSGRNYD